MPPNLDRDTQHRRTYAGSIMGANRFFLSETNPNDGIGGGGCMCSPLKCEDAKGPYAIFAAIETDSNLSPHAVLCFGCAVAVAEGATDPAGDLLSAGSPDVLEPPVDSL